LDRDRGSRFVVLFAMTNLFGLAQSKRGRSTDERQLHQREHFEWAGSEGFSVADYHAAATAGPKTSRRGYYASAEAFLVNPSHLAINS
jgi:hypothetical protein